MEQIFERRRKNIAKSEFHEHTSLDNTLQSHITSKYFLFQSPNSNEIMDKLDFSYFHRIINLEVLLVPMQRSVFPYNLTPYF